MKIKRKNHSDSAQRRGKTASCQIMLGTKEQKSGAQHGKQVTVSAGTADSRSVRLKKHGSEEIFNNK